MKNSLAINNVYVFFVLSIGFIKIILFYNFLNIWKKKATSFIDWYKINTPNIIKLKSKKEDNESNIHVIISIYQSFLLNKLNSISLEVSI